MSNIRKKRNSEEKTGNEQKLNTMQERNIIKAFSSSFLPPFI